MSSEGLPNERLAYELYEAGKNWAGLPARSGLCGRSKSQKVRCMDGWLNGLLSRVISSPHLNTPIASYAPLSPFMDTSPLMGAALALGQALMTLSKVDPSGDDHRMAMRLLVGAGQTAWPAT